MNLPESRLSNFEIVYETGNKPQQVEFICTVEWTWSPSHERKSNYYLSQSDTHEQLWSTFFDEMTDRESWCCCVKADNSDLEPEEVASNLLSVLWKHEAENSSIGMFDLVSDYDLLSEEQIFALGEMAWPG